MGIPETTFAGLNAAQWTAIGTISLALVTAVYVVLTAKTLNAARGATQAAVDAAAIQRAGVEVSFKVELTFLGDSRSVLRIVNTGATVYVHKVAVNWVTDYAMQERLLSDYEPPMRDTPSLMHRDDTMMWGMPDMPSPERGSAGVGITYSYDVAGQTREIRRSCSVDDLTLPVESPKEK